MYNEKVKTTSGGAITDNNYYLHRDYLGSIIAISNQAGIAIERRHFDAWGNLVKLQQNGVAIATPTSNGGLEALMLLDRGYTSHEHLAEVGLINMNGRLYDPKLHTFLMPDNFVQQPENTQNYNRYGYVLNNPLKYTDPSGEEIISLALAVGIGAFIGAATYYVGLHGQEAGWSWSGLAQATFIGAASAAVTFGIGSASSAMFSNFYSQAAFQAVAHGTFQGGMTAINGGNFWQGFAAGALSSIASSAWSGGSSFDTVGDVTTETVTKGLSSAAGLNNGVGTILFGTLAGGGGALLTKGNFWQGAVTGFFVSAFNHSVHGTPKKGYTSRQFKMKEGTVTSEKLVYFKKGEYKGPDGKMYDDRLLYAQAMSENMKSGVLSIFAHGYNHNVNYLVQEFAISAMFLNDSVMWQNFKSSGGTLTMDLKLCNTGVMSSEINIGQHLTNNHKGLTIYAPAGFWHYDGTIANNAGYNKFFGGQKVHGNFNR